MLMVVGSINANQPICNAKEYAKYVCSTVYVQGKPIQQCQWVCVPLSGAGR